MKTKAFTLNLFLNILLFGKWESGWNNPSMEYRQWKMVNFLLSEANLISSTYGM